MGDISLEDLLIHEGIDYKETSGAKGEQLNIKGCPKCGQDKWDKVYANAETSAGNCFSCGITFNLWKFTKLLLESRTGREPEGHQVAKYLNDIRRKMGYRPKVRTSAPLVTVTTRDTIEFPTSQPLPFEDGWVHPYLLKRGIDGHYAKMFGLRYSAFGVWQYQADTGETKKQSFAERIIIPVYDLDGNLKNFQGRDVGGLSEMKYKFAGGLPATGLYLYNAHVAKARKAKRVVLGEGAFDVMGIQKAIDTAYEFHDVVPLGSWGKHLSQTKTGDDQVGAFQKLRKEGLEQCWLMYDPEPAAYEEALKAADLLLKINVRPMIALLPKGVDPGDADAITILSALASAKEFTRVSSLRMRLNNPYK